MRHIITLLLMLPLLADAQIYIDSYRFGVPPDPGFILDTFPGAAAAYSLRKLDNDYTGNCITVQRDNGDTSLIGFDMNYLDTAAMKTFCGEGAGDSCRVRRWWDQSGNNRNFFQDTMTLQPLVMADGVVLRDNGEVSLRFDGSDDGMFIPSSTAMFNFAHNGGDASFFGVQRFGNSADPNINYNILANGGGFSLNIGFVLAYDDRSTIPVNNAFRILVNRGVAGTSAVDLLQENIITPNQISLIYSRIDADNATAANRAKAAIDGGLEFGSNTSTDSPSASNASFNLQLGRNVSNTGAFFGYTLGAIQELIIYNADKTSDRAAIENNINTFYSIY
jgi:hypothetical protein